MFQEIVRIAAPLFLMLDLMGIGLFCNIYLGARDQQATLEMLSNGMLRWRWLIYLLILVTVVLLSLDASFTTHSHGLHP